MWMCAALVLGCTHSHVPVSYTADSLTVDTTVSYDSLFERGEEMMERAEFVAATDYFLYLIETTDSSDLESRSDCLSELSVCYLRRGMFAEAFDAATRVIALDEQLGDKERLVYSLNTLGSLYALNRQPIDAEKYIRRSLDIAIELGDSAKMAGRNGSLSEVLLSRDRSAEALAAANEAVRIDSLRHDTARIAIRWVQKASVLEAMGQLDDARALLDTAMPVLRNSGNLTSLAICLNQLGSIALKQERWAEAEQAYDEALAINLRTGNRNGQVKSHLGLWKALRTSDTERAADHLEAYSLLRDSLFQEGTLQVMADYDARYELDHLQQQALRQQRINHSIIVGAILLALAFFVAMFFQLRSLRERKLRVRQWQEKYLAAIAAAPTSSPSSSSDSASLSSDPSSPSSSSSSHPVPSMPSSSSRDPFMLKVDAILEQQMVARQVDLQLLSDTLCISRAHLNRRIKQLEGITTRDYVSRFRTEKACMLLGLGTMKIIEVAHACGFDDESYFSRFFRKETGMTPSQFSCNPL